MRFLPALLLFLASGSVVADQPAWEPDAKALLEGVKEIAGPGAPGTVATWGPKAFPVVLAGDAWEKVPVVAAAQFGRGRVVAFAHDGYGSADAMEKADTGTLMLNAVRWAAGTARKLKVGVVGSDLAAFLNAKSIEAVKIEPAKAALSLGGLDVVCVFHSDLGPAAIEALDRFIADGNGLVAGVTGWGWSQVHGGADVRTNPLNRLIAPAGLAWTADFAKKTSGDGFAAGEVPDGLSHAGIAIDTLEWFVEKSEGGFPAGQLAQAEAAALAAVRVLPAEASDLRARLSRLSRDRATHLVPTEKTPLTVLDGLDRFLLTAQVEDARLQPPEKVPALAAAAAFPGAVPKDARPVERDLAMDAAVPDWHSTGLYVPPGQPVTVTVPDAAAAAKLVLRIGAHSDTIFHVKQWTRAPDVTAEFPIAAVRTTVASPFGGLLYLVVPDGCALGKFSIHVSGAVEAPFYILGKTTLDSWKRLRSAPGPWAELGSEKVILTVPSSCIRDLDDPKSLMEFWDRVLDAAADLARIPKERKRPERYVADIEISAGYMHAGYPIMTHLDAAPRMVSLAKMQKGDWGLFHELGHNHQVSDWTFEGTGEVTCNLWSLYLSETLCNLKPEEAHEALKDREKRAREHCRNGADFAKWKDDPFLALMMYVQLREQFGWEPFKEAFAAYRALPAAERPLTDQEKRDQWLVRFSRAAKKDLGPYFDVWGVPTSAEARESLKKLPRWMPADFPGRK
ncbi:MAG: M60 family metallopeptidase [Planctomycetota bacterium]